MHEKSAQRRRKHRAGCSKAEPKILAPPQTPFPGARDGQNLISWRWSLPLPTNPVWWGSMHAILSYRGKSPTNTPTHKQTGPITIHCTAASVQCNKCSEIGSPFVSALCLTLLFFQRSLQARPKGLQRRTFGDCWGGIFYRLAASHPSMWRHWRGVEKTNVRR